MSSEDLIKAAKQLSTMAVMSGRCIDRDKDFIVKYKMITGCNEDVAMGMLDRVRTSKVDQEAVLSIVLMGYTNENIENMMQAKDCEVVIQLILKLKIYPRK